MGTTIGRHQISKQYSHVVLNSVPYNKSESYLRKKWCVYRTKDMGDLENIMLRENKTANKPLIPPMQKNIIFTPGLIGNKALYPLLYKQNWYPTGLIKGVLCGLLSPCISGIKQIPAIVGIQYHLFNLLF